MSNIDLREFVNINLVRHENSSISNIRDTVVLYTNAQHTPVLDDNDQDTYTGLFDSLVGVDAYFAKETVPYKYLKMFFDNQGIKVLVKDNVALASFNADLIKTLDNKYICIAYANADELTSQADVYNVLVDIAEELAESTYGITQKILLARTESDDEVNVKNFGVKYSTEVGAEMTIAAYLSGINVYKDDTVYDYAFTEEKIPESNINNETFKDLMNHNFNVDIDLANAVRNTGGNCKNGEDLVNSYVLIILHQTLTDALVNLLTQKIKGSQGVSQIYSAMTQELEKYLNCGYLATDKIWTDEDLIVTKNGVNYTIIEKGTPLLKGYSIKVLPFDSLTTAQKANHEAPEVYVIIADQYGIRKITVTGEVL